MVILFNIYMFNILNILCIISNFVIHLKSVKVVLQMNPIELKQDMPDFRTPSPPCLVSGSASCCVLCLQLSGWSLCRPLRLTLSVGVCGSRRPFSSFSLHVSDVAAYSVYQSCTASLSCKSCLWSDRRRRMNPEGFCGGTSPCPVRLRAPYAG